jgi:hypothetical protein
MIGGANGEEEQKKMRRWLSFVPASSAVPLRPSSALQAAVESRDRLQEPAADSSEKPPGTGEVQTSVLGGNRLRATSLSRPRSSRRRGRAAPGEGASFTGQDRVQDPEATYSSNVVQNSMNLKVHLIQGFLHVQDVLSCHLNQAGAMSPERSHGADESRRSEAGTE